MFGGNSSGRPEIDVEYKFDSVTEFYNSCEKMETGASERQFKEYQNHYDRSFQGLSKDEIHKHKFAYRPGLEKLKDISDITTEGLGGAQYKSKWDEFDGDSMSYERLMEGDPALRLRRRSFGGKKQGKFITLKIVISELCNVRAEEMLWKTYTAAKITETLEKEGYRLKIIIINAVSNMGHIKTNYVKKFVTEITLKNFDQPLNLPLLITTTSPWFFRYWCFRFMTAKVHCGYGLGQSLEIDVDEDSKDEFVINNGESLCKRDSEKLIKKISEKVLNKKDGKNTSN